MRRNLTLISQCILLIFMVTGTARAATCREIGQPMLDLSKAQEVSRAEMQAFLTQFQPSIEMIPYQWHPKITRWISVCRAAANYQRNS